MLTKRTKPIDIKDTICTGCKINKNTLHKFKNKVKPLNLGKRQIGLLFCSIVNIINLELKFMVANTLFYFV